MVKYQCEEGKVELKVVGDLAELSADVTLLIGIIYRKLNAEDSGLALAFLQNMADGIKYILQKGDD